MNNKLTVLPEDKDRRKKIFEKIKGAIVSGDDFVDVLAEQGKSNEEQIEDVSIIHTYGVLSKHIKVYPNRIEISFKDGETGEKRTKTFLQFEVLGNTVTAIEQRLDILKSLLQTYLYYFYNIGEHSQQRELMDKYVKEAYYNTFKNIKNENGIDAIEIDNECNHDENLKLVYVNLLKCNFLMCAYMIVATNQIYRDKVEIGCAKVLDEKIQYLKSTLNYIMTKDVEDKDDEYYAYIASSLWKDSDYSDILKKTFEIEYISDQNAIGILEIILGKDKISDFVRQYPDSIVERKAVINYVINNGYITESEYKQIIDKDVVLNLYNGNGNKELLKYMKKDDIIMLYLSKRINLDMLTKHVRMSDLLSANVSSDKKMRILEAGHGQRVFRDIDSNALWNLFEKDGFHTDDMHKLNSLRYMHISTIINSYYEQKKRKIGAELGLVQNVSDKKLYDFFIPEVVCGQLSENLSSEELKFYTTDLKLIYQNNGDDLEHKMMDVILEKYKDDTENAKNEILQLYKIGLFSASTLTRAKLSDETYIEYYINEGADSRTLLDFYNNGLITQDNLFNLFEDEIDSKLIELINDGMSATVLDGLYSTAELITKARYGALSFENLAMISSNIKTGLNGKKSEKTLLDMYLSDELSYSELYGLAEAGVISEKEADLIDGEYNDRKGIEVLMGRGLKGVSVEYLYSTETNTTNQKNIAKKTSANVTPSISAGIDRDLIIKFYKKLGVSQIKLIDSVKCPIFDGYCLVPIPNMKVCILEGLDNSRTYIVPLKIILEQINNPGSDLDLVGNAKSRSQFNRNKKYIESANHTKNWGKNVIRKLSSASHFMTKEDTEQLIKQNQDIINELEQSYNKNRGIRENI